MDWPGLQSDPSFLPRTPEMKFFQHNKIVVFACSSTEFSAQHIPSVSIDFVWKEIIPT
jgi:hypothetical protein